jgi:hypothetical protein
VGRKSTTSRVSKHLQTCDRPLVAGDGPLLIGVGSDQARVQRKPFPADMTLAKAPLQRRLEQKPQDITVPEPTIPVARECGVVRHPAVEPEVAKPAIGQVEISSHSRRSDRMPCSSRQPASASSVRDQSSAGRCCCRTASAPCAPFRDRATGRCVGAGDLRGCGHRGRNRKQLRRRRLHLYYRPAPPQINTRMELRQPMPINGRLNQQYPPEAAARA